MSMADHFSNEQGLINDGFVSVLHSDDMEHLIKTMTIWKNHLEINLEETL
jgi:hypothetical protein